MSTEKVTITNGTINADNVTVNTQLYANAVSVTGDVTIDGELLVDGKDILQEISGQKTALENHVLDMGTSSAPHLTSEEHAKFLRVAELFDGYTDAPEVPLVDSPTGAITQRYLPILFSEKAEEGWPVQIAPGHVFISRVPYARIGEDNNVYYGESSFYERANGDFTTDSSGNYILTNSVYEGIKYKLLDNENLKHTCSTDTVEGVDDYVGKEWAFFWEYGNYIQDAYGVKHLTSIRNVPAGSIGIGGTTYTLGEFKLTENTAAFGPAFWFFCKPDPTNVEEGTGHTFTQYWGISDRPWTAIDASHPMFNGIVYPGLSVEKKNQLTALGITEADFKLWPSCRVWDSTNSKWVIRPYWCHSAFCGGYHASYSGVVSMCNAPAKPYLSYSGINTANGLAPAGMAGSANINGFGMLFDIVKNATKDSQSIHAGLTNGGKNFVAASHSLTVAENEAAKATFGGYIFPVASTAQFAIGRTVRLCADIDIIGSDGTTPNTSSTNALGAASYYPTTNKLQIGRIKNIIASATFTASGVEATGPILVIDPAEGTCNPVAAFSTHTTLEAATLAADTEPACYSANVIHACGGETLNGGTGGSGVIGKHDGSIVSNTNMQYVYRVQGTEYSPGAYIAAADTVTTRGDGTVPITYWNGTSTVTEYPGDETNVVLIMNDNSATSNRRTDGATITAWTNAGYTVTGTIPNKTGTWTLNVQLSQDGVACPILQGTSSTLGVRDYLYSGAKPAEFLSGGALDNGSGAGSACLSIVRSFGGTGWSICARA